MLLSIVPAINRWYVLFLAK